MQKSHHYLHHTFRPERFELADALTMGKLEAEIIFPHSEMGSPHCRFVEENGDISIIDLNSGFPSIRKGKKLRPYRPYKLNEGDQLHLGPENFIYSKHMILQPGQDHPQWQNSNLFPGAPEQLAICFALCLAVCVAAFIFVPHSSTWIWALMFAIGSLSVILVGYFFLERKIYLFKSIPWWPRLAMRFFIVPIWMMVLWNFGLGFRANKSVMIQSAMQEKVDQAARIPASENIIKKLEK